MISQKEDAYVGGVLEDPYIQEQRENATVQALQKAVVLVVKRRFPGLEETAQQTIAGIREAPALELLITQVSGAPDEDFARTLLHTSAA